MAFSFYGYQPERPMEQPLNNLVRNVLGGYTEGTKAQYLRPTLEEQLQKARLYNKWYGPNMQSQIGLRGAQAGHLGAMTEGLNISNPFLRQKLEDEQSKRQFERDNPLMSQTGVAGQIGALMYLQQHPELMKEISSQSEPAFTDNQYNNGLSSYITPLLKSGVIEQGNINLNNRPLVKNPSAASEKESADHAAKQLHLQQEALYGNPNQAEYGQNFNQKRNEQKTDPFHLLQKSIINNLKGKNKQTTLEAAQNYAQQQEEEFGVGSEQAKTAKAAVNKIAYGNPSAKKQTTLELAQNYAKEQEQEYGKNSKQAKTAEAYVDKLAHGTPKQRDLALEQHRERQLQMAKWKSLPANAKAHSIAIGQGAGFSADETEDWLLSGKPLKDLIYQHGFEDESEVEPSYQLTNASQTQLQNRNFASKEAKYLSNFIEKATGDYAASVAGYSPSLIKDQLTGKNEEEQAMYMAARGLSQELVNLRLVLAGAKSTVSAQNQLREKSLLDMKNIRTLVSPKVWGRTQKIMDDELQAMFKQAKTGFGQKISSAINKSNSTNNLSPTSQPKITPEEARAELERRKAARG